MKLVRHCFISATPLIMCNLTWERQILQEAVLFSHSLQPDFMGSGTLRTSQQASFVSSLLSAVVIANVWLSGSRAVSHEPHRTKQMHLFSQLEEFANVHTRVNSLANLHQTQIVVPAEALQRSLSSLACCYSPYPSLFFSAGRTLVTLISAVHHHCLKLTCHPIVFFFIISKDY